MSPCVLIPLPSRDFDPSEAAVPWAVLREAGCDVRFATHRFPKASGLFRDSAADASPAFVVQDGVYVSARWPGDVHLFARTFAALLAPVRKEGIPV